jgi:hypothetical protein
VKEAKGAGIDGFISAWTGVGTDTDANFARLLDIAAKQGFAATVYFETNSVVQRGAVADQLGALLAKYGNHPAFLRWGGKPVVFFWSPQTIGNAAAWRSVRQQVDPGNGQLWSVDTTDASYLDVFDTIHFFSAGKWAGNTDVGRVNAQWRATVDNYNKSHGTKRLWTAGVIPGWDESRVQPPRNAPKVFARRDGALYDEAWKGATASNPEWVTITSWNEWYEGTQIEPAASYGNRYLDLTRQYAARWKGTAEIVPVPPPAPAPVPVGGQPLGACAGGTLFPETGKVLCKQMEPYWRQYGGLAQFGFPISDAVNEKSELDGKTYTVQYFERARFELHPELRGTPYEVMLSQLGTLQYKKMYPGGGPGEKANHEAGQLFPETGKWVGGAFLQRWQNNGGLFVNGYPISDEFMERAADGKTYTVQYFERARFEFHPENPREFIVLLGMLGRQAFEARGR